MRIEPTRPSQLTDPLTPVEDLFVVNGLGLPDVDAETWRLDITGLVSTPITLSFDDLERYPKRTLDSVHVCAGNPAKPTMPRRWAANLRWGGADLGDILADAGLDERATHLWAYGLDYGTYAGTAQPHYLKDMPVSYLAEGGALLAYEMNGAPLSAKNGFPVRLVIPGFYGTNSVKWLARIEASDRRAESLFTTRYYNDPDGDGTKPVWSLAPESLFVSPAPETRISMAPTEIWGWAWSSAPVRRVEISTDSGETWLPAKLERRNQRSWQRFSMTWTPDAPGPFELRCRATDTQGETQPSDGARNAMHAITVEVAG